MLIGGSSRIPLVQRLLTEMLQEKLLLAPLGWEKADIAVALGAAYHAYSLWGQPRADPAQAAKAEWDVRSQPKEAGPPHPRPSTVPHLDQRAEARLSRAWLADELRVYGERFEEECAENATKLLESDPYWLGLVKRSDPEWSNKLTECLNRAAADYIEKVQRAAQAEVSRLKPGARVPPFVPGRSLSVDTDAGDEPSFLRRLLGPVAGSLAAQFALIFAGITGGPAVIGASAVGWFLMWRDRDKARERAKERARLSIQEAVSKALPLLRQAADNYLDEVERWL